MRHGGEPMTARSVRTRRLLAFAAPLVLLVASASGGGGDTPPPIVEADGGASIPASPAKAPCDGATGSIGPCAQRDVSTVSLFAPPSTGAAYEPVEATSLEDVLEKGLLLTEASPVHLRSAGCPTITRSAVSGGASQGRWSSGNRPSGSGWSSTTTILCLLRLRSNAGSWRSWTASGPPTLQRSRPISAAECADLRAAGQRGVFPPQFPQDGEQAHESSFTDGRGGLQRRGLSRAEELPPVAWRLSYVLRHEGMPSDSRKAPRGDTGQGRSWCR